MMCAEQQIISKARVTAFGEVMTAEREVKAMMDLVADEALRIESRFLEPSCGTGNFMVEVLRRKLSVVERDHGGDIADFECKALVAVSSIYGVEIQSDNVDECRRRLLALVEEVHARLFAADKLWRASFLCRARSVLHCNVIWGDFLKMTTCGPSPRPIKFIDWS